MRNKETVTKYNWSCIYEDLMTTIATIRLLLVQVKMKAFFIKINRCYDFLIGYFIEWKFSWFKRKENLFLFTSCYDPFTRSFTTKCYILNHHKVTFFCLFELLSTTKVELIFLISFFNCKPSINLLPFFLKWVHDHYWYFWKI